MFQIVLRNGETWAFTGGRAFADQSMFDDVLAQLTDRYGCPDKIVHGHAKGLDAMAAEWANRMAIPSIGVAADWDTYGKGAGPVRNEKIIKEHKPKRLIAFPGGRGTADMVRRAKNNPEIEVIEIVPKPALDATMTQD